MAIDLFDGEADADASSDDDELKINEEFARRFEHNKRREALQRLEELKKRGLAGHSDDDDDSEESSSSEDDTDLAKSRKNDIKYFETLVKIKKQDPAIFGKDNKIYSSDEDDREEDEMKKQRKAAKKERPLYLKDVNARQLMEEGPEFEDKPLKYQSKIYNKEQAEGIKAFLEAEKAAFAAAADEDDILKEKEKAADDEEEDDADAQELHHNLDEYFGKDNDLSENEKFLKDYLLNKMWVDKDDDKKPAIDDFLGVSEDEDELEKQDLYEAEYNFHHEEGEADRVLGHSRIVDGSVRKKTNSRKVQRKSKEERMAQAEFERKEELKHLKNLKKKEIQEKLEKIRAIAGILEDGAVKLDEDYLDEDFDPDEYDRKMQQMFGDDYYGAEDVDPGFGSGEEGNFEKPDFEKEDELLGLPEGWDAGASSDGFEAARERFLKQKHEEEPEEDVGLGRRKRKRKISLKEKVELDKELEEYYKLDYEDTIGDLKTRFKYRSVPANRYGLQSEEILMTNEKDLNQYVSLKKLAPYREKEWEVTYHQRKKKSLILHGEKSDEKNLKQHKSKKTPGPLDGEERKEVSEMKDGEGKQLSRRERRKRRRIELKLPESRLMAYGKLPSRQRKD